jgi:hypothetical protein
LGYGRSVARSSGIPRRTAEAFRLSPYTIRQRLIFAQY